MRSMWWFITKKNKEVKLCNYIWPPLKDPVGLLLKDLDGACAFAKGLIHLYQQANFLLYHNLAMNFPTLDFCDHITSRGQWFTIKDPASHVVQFSVLPNQKFTLIHYPPFFVCILSPAQSHSSSTLKINFC